MLTLWGLASSPSLLPCARIFTRPLPSCLIVPDFRSLSLGVHVFCSKRLPEYQRELAETHMQVLLLCCAHDEPTRTHACMRIRKATHTLARKHTLSHELSLFSRSLSQFARHSLRVQSLSTDVLRSFFPSRQPWALSLILTHKTSKHKNIKHADAGSLGWVGTARECAHEDGRRMGVS